MAEPFSWTKGNELIADLGGEEWLAARIGKERRDRGWSQAQLSAELKRVGHPMHQSAISKIESPPAEGKRAITIGELIGFAKVFELPVGELLLPPGSVDIVRGLRALADGPRMWQTRANAISEYNKLVADLVEMMQSELAIREAFVERSGQAEARVERGGGDRSDSIELAFLDDVVRALREAERQ